jgi:hypothetical protein
LKRIVAAAAVAALSGLGSPAHADVTVCLGGVTLVVAGQTVVDQSFDCVVIDTP